MSKGFVQALAEDINIPLDLLKTVILMIVSIPLSYVFRWIHTENIRYIYSLVTGLVFLIYLLDFWAYYVLLCSFLPYIAFKILKKRLYVVAIVFGVGFLMFIHVYRFLYDYMSWKIDCSVAVMFMVTKVVYYASYIDHHKSQLSFFQYSSYCLFFPAVLIGPTFSFTLFKNFISKSNGYENPQLKAKLLIIEIVKTLSFSVATVLLLPTFTPYWALKNQWYQSLSPILRFLSLNVIGVFYRIKFYSAWGFIHLAIDMSGLSWNEKQQNYSNVRCGSPMFQIQINPRNKTAYWNSSIQTWLKEMIFDKIVSQTKSSTLATFLTFFASALWHGIYWTYYVGFIQWAIIITVSKWGYRMSQVLPKLSKMLVVRIITFLVCSSLLNYTGMFIVILTWNEAVQAYKDMDFIGNIMMGILLICSFVVKPSMFKRKEKVKGTGQEHNGHKE